MASQFNDPGTNNLFSALMKKITEKTGIDFEAKMAFTKEESEKVYIIPPDRTRYLAEIAEANQAYGEWVNIQSKLAQQLFQLHGTIEILEKHQAKAEEIE